MAESLARERLSPILIQPHLDAMDRRLRLVSAAHAFSFSLILLYYWNLLKESRIHWQRGGSGPRGLEPRLRLLLCVDFACSRGVSPGSPSFLRQSKDMQLMLKKKGQKAIKHFDLVQGRKCKKKIRGQFFPPPTEIQGHLNINWRHFLKLV